MDNTRNILGRNNSICPTVEELLLDAVRSNKLQKIRDLIKENERLLSVEYGNPFFGKILFVACSEEEVSSETFQLLLQLSANPTQETEGQGEIIHVLTRFTNYSFLKVLIGFLTKEELNHTYRGNNALLVLVKEGDYSKRAEFLECARILIKSGINVNHADLKNFTAILWAIKKDYRELIEVFLNNCFDMDFDNYKMNGKTAREWIVSKYSSELVLPDNFTTISCPKDLLFNYLKSHNEDAFVKYNNGDISEYKDSDDHTQTLLQLSCQLGLLQATKHLLDNRADVRKTTEKQTNSPLALAGENGHFEIVECLLEYDATLRVPSSVLSILLNKMNISESDKYEKCFEQLLSTQDEISLNSLSDGKFKQTPLHFAVKFAKNKHILELLRKGSSLANKNEFGIMAIENIEADVLEQHLDDCVDINDVDKNNVYVTLKYNTLLPSPERENTDTLNYCEEGQNKYSQIRKPETDALLYMCKAPYLKHLLNHPVIDTFLLLKWHKINMIFYTNLVFYIFFNASLLTYIFSYYANFHYIEENDSFLLTIKKFSYFILFITYVVLVIRECFQILVNPTEYYKDIDNWIEVILIFIVGSIIFTADPSNDTRKQLSSLAILLSTFELILMVGQHPRLTTNVVMFKRVSANFIKFLAWYFLLIAAFAMSFFILFSENMEEKQGGNEGNATENDEENHFFINPGAALFKTLVMLTGEFDASDLNFHSFPITSKVIFIMFVLMIALILLNLLNGLAVSDTQTIKNDAECVGLVARTEHIHYMETMVLGNILPSTLLNILNKICCCLTFEYNLNIIISQPLSKHISLFPKTEITIPMSNDFELMKVDKKGSKRDSALSVFNSLKLDKKIQRKIRKVMQNQKMINNDTFLKGKIKQIENQQNEILKLLNNINQKLPDNLN